MPAAIAGIMRFSTLITISMTALCALSTAGCSSSTAADITDTLLEAVVPGSDAPEQATASVAGKQMCMNAVASLARNQVARGEAPSRCDIALATDCQELVGLFSDTYVDSIARCLDSEGTPAICIMEATLALQPTDAHHELASRYCDQCAFDLPACEDIFYFGPKDQLGLGMVALPFSDSVVRQIADECTGDLTCAVDLPGCAQEILQDCAIPDETVRCLLNPFEE